MSITRRTAHAVLCTALASAGISVLAAPSYATPPGDTSGVITAPSYVGNSLIAYQSGSPDGTGVTQWSPDSGARGGQGLAYSPDGSRIAFYSDSDLWVARADGTQAHVVAATGQYNFDGRPAWSPDGTAVYFQDTSGWAEGDCSAVVDRALADGAQARPIAVFPFAKVPGGCPSTVVTLSTSVSGDVAISLSGGNGVRIWHPSDGSLTTLSVSGLVPNEADYSPDGTSLVFVGDAPLAGGGSYPAGVYVDELATSALTQIVSYGGDPNVPGTFHDFRTPVWAPDGSAVAYLYYADDGSSPPPNKLEVYHFATHTSTLLTGFHAAAPLAWRPKTAPLPAPAVPTADRIGGADRIETAVDASRFEFAAASATAPGSRKAACAVLTRSDSYADALSGSAFAGAKSCPLLLTPTGAVPGNVLDELRRVLPKGATVYVLGGPGAVSPNAEGQVAAAGFTTRRLAGGDRYATSLAIVHELSAHPKLLLVATADNYPDALAAGAVAAGRADAVVLTVPSGRMTADDRAYVASAMADPSVRLTAVGEPGSTAVETAFGTPQILAWGNSYRLSNASGSTRYETAAALFDQFGLVTRHTVALATGTNWADALAGGAVAGLNNALLLLTDGSGLPGGQAQYLGDPSDPVAEVLVFGGTGVVPPGAVSALEAATGENPWVSFENRSAPVLP